MSTVTPPFISFLTGSQRWWLLATLAVGAVLVMAAVLRPLDKRLQARVPLGILALEFAWSGARARALLAAWHGLEGVIRRQTCWDYLFLLCYPLALSLACAMLSAAPANPLPTVGAWVAWAALAASPLDAVENLALLGMVRHGATEARAKGAAVCAGLKFAVVLAAVGYLCAGGLAMVWRSL